ncbi:MAG: MBL fold metallo-hydrolase [Syntrophomonadaceae bacterium]|nr:MBL fold metallo-hydrolase [Syntrophomonadaceae bacterium]
MKALLLAVVKGEYLVEFRHIAGHTYIIETSAIVLGVYIFSDNSCLLIDSGGGKKFAHSVVEKLREKGLSIYGILNTHAHADHCGGNNYIQAISDCGIYASALERPFIENPILTPLCYYSAYPVKALRNKFLMPSPSQVTAVIEPGKNEINGVEFNIIDLAGHSIGQVGVETPDKVTFLGDALIGQSILEMFPFIYATNLENHLQSFRRIAKPPLQESFLSHGGRINDISALIRQNNQIIDRILETIKKLIEIPKSREEIVSHFISLLGIHVSRTQYFLISESISAYLTYLCDTQQASVYITDGLLLFKIKDSCF